MQAMHLNKHNTSLVRYACAQTCNAEDLQERRRENYKGRHVSSEETIVFSSRSNECPRGYSIHFQWTIIIRQLRQDNRGLALDPHIRHRASWKAHGRPRHRQEAFRVALHIPLLRIPRFQSPCCPQSSFGTLKLAVAEAPSLRPDCVANFFRKASTKMPITPLNHRPK